MISFANLITLHTNAMYKIKLYTKYKYVSNLDKFSHFYIPLLVDQEIINSYYHGNGIYHVQ